MTSKSDAVLTSASVDRPSSPAGRPVTYVYLMSHGFSGSTLLTFLLGAHPEISTVGEMGIAPKAGIAPDEFVCSCQQLVGDCGFWRRVSAEMKARGYDFDIRTGGLLFDPDSDHLPDRLLASALRPRPLEVARRMAIELLPAARTKKRIVVGANEAFIDVVCGLKGCRTFLDSSKRPERAVRLLESGTFNVRVLHLVRDPRAVSYSCVKNLGVTIEEGATSVAETHDLCMRAKRYFRDDAWLTVRYEDLCRDVPGVLERIFEFVEVTNVPIDNFRESDHHIIGNRMRLQTTSQIVLDESWKTALSLSDLDVVASIAGPAHRALGYTD